MNNFEGPYTAEIVSIGKGTMTLHSRKHGTQIMDTCETYAMQPGDKITVLYMSETRIHMYKGISE